MPRRRGGAKSISKSPELTRQATSPETRLRRATRGASLTPSKPARRHPTEALHMTTRAAASAASTAGTDSAADSVASADSRRSSFNLAAEQAAEAEEIANHHQHSTNGTRPSAEVEQPPADSAEPDASELPPSQPPKSNKRKRSLAVDDDPVVEPHVNGVNGTTPLENGDAATSEDAPTADAPPRKRQSKGKGRGRAPLSTQTSFAGQSETTTTPASNQSPEKETTDQQNVSENPDADGDKPTKQTKRLPGRRRAPNSNPSIEADLRRQLQLKTAYRAVVKVLKPVLAELADRTINDVEDDPIAHQQSDQYEMVKAALDARLADQLAYLNSKYNHTKTHVDRRDTAETEIAKTEFENVFRCLQEDFLIRCQHQLLAIEREASMQEQDGYATEDEDGLVPRRRGMQYKWRSTGFLDPASDSRSRFFTETQKLMDRHDLREASKKKRNTFLQENTKEFDRTIVDDAKDFTTYNADYRAYATAVFNTSRLADAADAVETERLPQYIKPIPNEDALGLQLLASAIDRPAESVHSRIDGTQSRASSTSMPSKSRDKQLSARSTPVKPSVRSRAVSPFETASAVSFGDVAMSLDSEREEEALAKVTEQLPVAEPQANNQKHSIAEPKPNKSYVQINDILRDPTPEPEPGKSYGNRVKGFNDILNKGDNAQPSVNSTPATESPAPLPPVILQPLSSAKATPEPKPAEAVLEAPSTVASTATQPEEPVSRAQTSSVAPEGQQNESANQPRKSFWDTIGSGSKARTSRAPTPEKTPLARIRQLLNPSNFNRKGSDATTISAGTPERLSEKPDMAPPAARASVSRDDVSSRRSSSATSVVSQAVSAPPQTTRSPVQPPPPPPKRASTRDPGLESRQNRWRAAVPPQHGPSPPFPRHSRGNSGNPPPSAFGKPHDWTLRETPVRSPLPPTGAPPPQPPPAYPSYMAPYDARAHPPVGYPPPPAPPYGPGPPPPNPYLTAVPGIRPPFPHPPGPPPYQSIYAPPPAGYPTHPTPYGPPPPPPPQHYAGPQYGGQPILPATTLDRRASAQQPPPPHQQTQPPPGTPPAFGGPPPPAFSQQQGAEQNGARGGATPGAGLGANGANGAGRGGKKRWRNHPAGTEFRPYTGPKGPR